MARAEPHQLLVTELRSLPPPMSGTVRKCQSAVSQNQYVNQLASVIDNFSLDVLGCPTTASSWNYVSGTSAPNRRAGPADGMFYGEVWICRG